MPETYTNTHVNTVVIGGGQAGLSVGYHLARQRVPFVILDGSARIGDTWRHRWDSLRLFTPARFVRRSTACRFPRRRFRFRRRTRWRTTSKRTPARLPCRCDRACGSIVCRASATGSSSSPATSASKPTTSSSRWRNYQRPRAAGVCGRAATRIVQLHSFEYRNPAQLHPGDVLVVGAGNSGAEIAHRDRRASPDVAGRTRHRPRAVPHRRSGGTSRCSSRLVLRVVFHRVLTIATPIGRKARGRRCCTGRRR